METHHLLTVRQTIYVTGFDKSQLPHTQQQDTVSPSHDTQTVYTLTNSSARY